MKPDEKHHASDNDLRRLVAADWWEWVPGMRVRNLAIGGVRPLLVTGTTRTGQGWMLSFGDGLYHPAASYLPVPSDPATAGCLMEMYMRGCKQSIALMALAASQPRPQEYASFGDFLVVQLLEDEG